MNASKYNAKQYQDGNLTDAMVTKLVQCWQRHNDLAVDGFAGPNTLHSLMSSGSGSLVKYFPLRLLGDGRKPVITSGFYTENPSRSTHHGVDFFYPWHSGDLICRSSGIGPRFRDHSWIDSTSMWKCRRCNMRIWLKKVEVNPPTP